MAAQYSVTLRNRQLDQIEATVGVGAKLRLYSGAKPANCAAASTGALLVDMDLPADWMEAASGGVKAKLGTWSGAGTADAGSGADVGHFRITNSTGSVCHMQGTVTATDGGGDMTLNTVTVAKDQVVTVTAFNITAGNA